ncbi:MAG: cupin [Ignavibacteria bacterium]
MEDNIFNIPDQLTGEFEQFLPIISNPNIYIERIISSGHNTPDGQWLEDDRNEWVLLIRGHSEILLENGETKMLNSGDHIMIGKNKKHRIVKTSKDPDCIWLAVYFE